MTSLFQRGETGFSLAEIAWALDRHQYVFAAMHWAMERVFTPLAARIVGVPTIALAALQNLCKTLMEF